jgi:hypothetical protein
MIWNIHYKTKGVAGIITVSTLPKALRCAGELLGQGTDVNQIEGSGGLKGMNAGEIRLACAERQAKREAREKRYTQRQDEIPTYQLPPISPEV